MKTTTLPMLVQKPLCLAGGSTDPLEANKSKKTMKKTTLISLVLMMAGIASAQNVPSGITGLWRFQNSTDKLRATIGTDLVNSTPANAASMLGPWTDIGIDSWHTKYSDGGIIQDRSWDYLTAYHGIGDEGKGAGNFINRYTILVDFYAGGSAWNSLYQTAANGNANDGDLWVNATTTTAAVIGVGGVGYSTMTFDASKWHRIVWSVDNGNFFRVYVDGTFYLNGVAQPVDGRWSLELDKFNLFADNNWEDAWCMAGTVAVWNRPLTSEEIAGMGGWLDGAATPTPLLFNDEPPRIVSMSPANGGTNVAPGFAFQASILDLVGLVNTNSVQLLLDGAPVSPVVTASPGSASVLVGFSGGGLLQSGSTHRYTLIASASGIYSTNETTFTVQNYTSYEWDFTNADLTATLGNGLMTYADPSTTPGLTSFGTTDGSAVPHINGNPAAYMHVPAFTLNTDGYWLLLNDSAPNVDGNPYINRYTLIFDMLVPGPTPWPTWVLPFFNADPYNLDSDSDFYLSGNGEIGIGGGGYSPTNTIQPDVWYRIAFVADLKANTLTYYVNGTNVKSRTADGLDGRWSLYSNLQVGPYPLNPANLLLFNEPTASDTHELYLSSLAFVDRVLSADEIAGLGGPGASGILAPSLATKPMLGIQLSAGSSTISWPGSYVGYRLEQADSLVAPQWEPVAGITNNSAVIPTTGDAKYFRLVQ